MIFKVALIICSILTCSIANAADNEFTLTYQKQNKWVAQTDLKPLINAVVFFKNNNLKIQAECSSTDDNLCQERVKILNHIFNKQNVQQNISSTIKSSKIAKNNLILRNINLDNSKYSNYILEYKNKNILPIKKSQTSFNNILKTSEAQYLSQFKMFCKSINKTCKDRFNHLNNKIAKSLTFMYNFALYENSSLEENTVQIVNHRHDYTINKPIKKPVMESKNIKPSTTEKQPEGIKNYTSNPNIIVFKKDSDNLLLLEKIKIEKLISANKANKFKFACGTKVQSLCQARVHAIKNYALKNTNNIIIMNEFLEKTTANYVIIK